MTEATPAAEKKDVVPSTYREKYKATGGTCGDFIAKKLSEVGESGVEALTSVKRENGIPADRWAGFNPGMQRMNLANVLRASFLKGETITILGKQYNAKHQAEDFNGEIKDDAKVLAKLAEFLDLQVNDRMIDALRKLFFSPPKKSAEDREAERKAKADAKQAEKDAAAKAKAITKAEGAVSKAKDAKGKADTALEAANTTLNEAIAANNAAEDKTATTKAVNAAQKKVDTAQEKADKATTALEEAEAALAKAKEA